MKRTNTIIMLSAGIFLVFLVPALFSQGSTDSKSPPQEQAVPETAQKQVVPEIAQKQVAPETTQKQITTEAPLNTETPQAPKDKIDVKSDAIERSIPSYRMRLKDILKEAEENIKKVDKELKEREVLARNQEREAKVVKLFESGNQLYKDGKLKEAQQMWRDALAISKDPEMRKYIEEASMKISEEDRRLEAEQKEKARLEREAKSKAEAEQKEKARLEREAEAKAKDARREAEKIAREKAREEKIRLEGEEREAKEREKVEADRIEAAQREESRKMEASQKEKARLEREAKAKAETEAKEKARLEKEAVRKTEAPAKGKSRQEREDAKKTVAELREKEEAAQLKKEAAEVQNMNVAAFGKNLESLYKEAVGYYKNGDIDKAKSAFTKIVRLYPNQTAARRYLDKEIPREMKKLSRSR
jgi:TolA-binding protein